MKNLTFVCEPIRNRNAKGLVSAGVKWREGTQLNRGKLFLGVCLLFCALLSHWFSAFMVWISGFGGFEMLTVGLVVWAIALILWPAKDRELSFGIDDVIESPLGLKRYEHITRWGYKVSDVLNIEAMAPQIPDADKFRTDVIMLMDDGETIHFAGDLHPEHAVKLARQLTKALQEVRAAMGNNTFYASAA